MEELRERLLRAIDSMMGLLEKEGRTSTSERATRLRGKLQGLGLALSYVEEDLRRAKSSAS